MELSWSSFFNFVRLVLNHFKPVRNAFVSRTLFVAVVYENHTTPLNLKQTNSTPLIRSDSAHLCGRLNAFFVPP